MTDQIRRLNRRYLRIVVACLVPQLLWLGVLVWFIWSSL